MSDIVHHIGPSDITRWHPVWHRCRDSWLQNWSGGHRLWNDREEIDDFVTEHYPEFANVYHALPYHVQRLDFARLAILHHHGGIYADLDYYCYRDFRDQCGHEFMAVANVDDSYTSARWENCLIWARPGCGFLVKIMANIKVMFIHYRSMLRSERHDWRNTETSYAVNNSTGSGMLHWMIQNHAAGHDIQAFPAPTHNPDPLGYDPAWYGKHIHTGLWGNEYLDHATRDFVLIRSGTLYNVSRDQMQQLQTEPDNVIMSWQDFDFYHDYRACTDQSS